jgi:hypothetical protein
MIDLETKPKGETKPVADQPTHEDLAAAGAAPVSPKDTAEDAAEDEQPIQATLDFIRE